MLSLIVAMANNRVIGKDNKMPWHLPADLQYFKKVTLGKTIIMGRKTYDSIGRPLPGRQNVVVTRQDNLQISGCDVVNSLAAALAMAAAEVVIIGGANLYAQALPLVDRMYVTFIEHDFSGDTFFPRWDHALWKEIEAEHHQADEKNRYPYRFVTFEKVKRTRAV